MKNTLKVSLSFMLIQSVVLLLVACTAEKPETVAIRETVVEVPAPIVMTQPAIIVEVEVTRIIEVMVTATGEKPTATPTRTPVAMDSLTPCPTCFEPHPYGDYTDIPEVNEIAKAVLARNVTALRTLVRLQPFECIEYPPWGPVCRDDEPVGTLVEAFSYAACEGSATRDEETIMRVLEDLVARATGVYAVYEQDWNESYGIVFTSIDNATAITVFVDDAGISWVFFGCGHSPDEALAQGNGDVILPPKSAGTSSGSK